MCVDTTRKLCERGGYDYNLFFGCIKEKGVLK